MSSAAPAGQLRAEDVSFAYVGAARAALRHVDLGVAPGEVVLITGASGCGKSTLALALCGLIPSRVHGELRGRVMFGPTALSGMQPHEASQLVGMVFQNPNLQLINQTVQSEVAFGPENLPWFWLKPSRAKIRALTVMIIGPAIAGFWGQGMYYLPPAPIHFLYKFPWTLAWLGSPGITSYGMIFGLQQTSRVLVTVSTSMLILISTDVGDFTWAFERFKAPPHVGFALTAALRFLPEMIARTSLVLRAVELRGYDMSRPRWYQFNMWPDYVKRISRCVVLVTVPLLIGTLRGTTTMAMVADARGFGASKKRGSLRIHKTTAVDIWGYAILGVLVVGALVLNHLGIGARYYG